MTWRKLRSFLGHLPPESATVTALRNAADPDELDNSDADPAEGAWSKLEMLTATMIDELRALRYVYVAANSKQKPEPPPDPVPRPGVKAKRSRKLSPKAAQWLFERINGTGSTEG